ncbi:NAD(P)-dependent oxidoreductase [Ureibacillus terrenus]|uniref:NAD(P)-dependent oxidoreductase n=1 Tax=Ureibacillus terrenus TaxID=118246 RepID=A0A540UZ02_9BACL|nr:NAD(P)-dependent oxidoreductase [Ureibacillus terrenus]MED3661923.1 NAD(P)-dependent oxidoreductase [Ureibacillus terrenus]MED3765071.1 NAD(P)-dependent oxidoreductase [Ureibacillus terrenus]TQE89712.1 NAD(P)-dependent oxidoreductase [Ureibacillus terrenus]
MRKEKIAFIGTGVMGSGIVKHLLNAGFEVTVYNRTKAKANPLLELGAEWADTPALAAENQDIIFTMVGFPKDVEEVYFGDKGIFKTAKENSVVIDMTTSKPSLAKKIYETAKEKGIKSLDAPVSGGDIGARNGTLSIMVGGDEQVFHEMLPIFELFGSNIVYHGEAGAGQHAKMCNQLLVTTNMIGVCECIAYGIKAGLDLEKVLRSVSTGAAGSWSLTNLGPRILKGDLDPGFYIKHFIKDMKIALEEAERMGLDLPGLKLAKEMYETLQERGYGDYGTQALIKYYPV